MAFVYLRDLPLPAALRRLRAGIQRLDRTHGRVALTALEAPGGYHETVTAAWVVLVAEALEKTPDGGSSVSLFAAHPELLDEARLSRYYSPERLSTSRARRSFVAPDLRPLPGDWTTAFLLSFLGS